MYDKVRKCKQWRGGCSHLVVFVVNFVNFEESMGVGKEATNGIDQNMNVDC